MRALVGDEPAWEALFERPLGETLSAIFDDELLAGVVLTDALIGTFAAADDALLRQNRCFLYHVIGRGNGEWLVPVGGMGAVTAALADAAAGAGARLCTNSEVMRIEPLADRVELIVGDGRHAADRRCRARARQRRARASSIGCSASPPTAPRPRARS